MIRNFGIVLPDLLYRSGKYKFKDLVSISKQYNIKRIIYLSETESLYKEKTYKKSDFEYLHIPIYEYKKVSDNIIDIILSDKITLIHCWKGSHRTGTIVALLRKRQGWNPQKTWGEMQSYGFGKPEKHIELFKSVFDENYSL